VVPFTVGGGEAGAQASAKATNVVVAGPRDILWEITGDERRRRVHDQLVDAIQKTLTFSPGT
jgi:hypothetical protein